MCKKGGVKDTWSDAMASTDGDGDAGRAYWNSGCDPLGPTKRILAVGAS